jgi:hypothetical protein
MCPQSHSKSPTLTIARIFIKRGARLVFHRCSLESFPLRTIITVASELTNLPFENQSQIIPLIKKNTNEKI